MPSGKMPPAANTTRFGGFALQPSLRRLEKDGVPVNLGGRALDILIVLVERAGEIVTHQQLQDRVWQNVTVEPSSLRVQMRALRKALGESQDGGQYIVNIAGRGYCFVAPVARALTRKAELAVAGDSPLPRLTPLVGRDAAVRSVIARLVETRFVTIAGTGGVGKSAVAAAVTHALVPAFGGAVVFLDLGDVTSPHAAHVMLGRAALRRVIGAEEEAVQGLVDALQGKRLLIVLDCCDHIAGAMGELAATLVRETADVHVLATNRERLGGAGEAAITLPPLACPTDADAVPVDALSGYASVRLLTDLVRRQSDGAQPADTDMRALARMTRQLDGLPLALELAAASIAQNGIAQTEAMIGSRFALFMTNPDTKMPRHASLSAALDWSYAQLTAEQRMIFRNIAVFAGPFTMDGIRDVAADTDIDAGIITDSAMALLNKSMIYRESGTESLRYRMLDTTRAFGMSKLLTFGDGELVKRRHATHILHYLTRANAAARGLSTARMSEGLTDTIHNIRAALEWCFSDYGDVLLGARLAAASAHVFNTLFLHTEIRGWLVKALSKLDEHWTGTQLELDIRVGILMNTMEPDDVHQIPLQLAAIIALADTIGNHHWRVEARAWECMLMAQRRPINTTLARAQTLRDITLKSDDFPTRLLGDWLLGLAYHLQGALHQVAPLCASAATLAFSTESIYFSGAQAHARIGAVGSMARTLWLQGQPDAALRVARAAMGQLRGTAPYRIVRVFLVPLFIWAGACQDAEDLLATIHQEAAQDIDVAFAHMYEGALYLRRGNAVKASAILQDGFDRLKQNTYGRFTTIAEQGIVAIHLAEALAMQGQFTSARRAIDSASAISEELGDSFFTPERYRVMGVVMTIAPPSLTSDAGVWFQRAIDCARRQGSLSFELRAATDLARFSLARGHAARAYGILTHTYERFTEGFDTPDLVEARNLLDVLRDAMRAPADLAVQG